MKLKDRQDWTMLFQNARKNAARRGIDFRLTREEFNEIVAASDGRCSVSGIEFRNDQPGGIGSKRPFIASLDRIDSRRGYEKSNCRLVCVVVNFAMNDFGMGPLMELIETMHATKVRKATKRIMDAARRRRKAAIESKYTENDYMPSTRFREIFEIPNDVQGSSLTLRAQRIADEEGISVRMMACPAGMPTQRMTPIRFAKGFPLQIWKRAYKEYRVGRRSWHR